MIVGVKKPKRADGKYQQPVDFLSVLKLLLTLGMLFALLTACTAPAHHQQANLIVTVSNPPAMIELGRDFRVSLLVENKGQYLETLQEIRLPAGFLEHVVYLGSNPDFTLIKDVNGDGILLFDEPIAPQGSLNLTFRFNAQQTGPLVGQGMVKTETNTYQFALQTEVSGVNPPNWQPGESPAATPSPLGKIPYPAVVQIKVMVDLNGETKLGWMGSGTIISKDGLILTNGRVVLSDRYYQVKSLVIALTVAQDQPPVDTYFASIVQADADLDVAVIKPTTNLEGIPLDYASLNLPFVPFGNSEALEPGDSVAILGYPDIGEETITTLTRGDISGFLPQEKYGDRAYISTTTPIAGGNSGGLAVNEYGELIGLPAPLVNWENPSVEADCRALADTNRDGVVDNKDNCVPTSGLIYTLRPLSLVMPLIESARAGEVKIVASSAPVRPFQPSTGEVVFGDDFSNKDSGWANRKNESTNAGYEEGMYTLEVLKPGYLTWQDLSYSCDDVIMSMDAQVINTTGEGEFGFICGYQDEDNFVLLEVAEDGYFSVWKHTGKDILPLVDWTYSDEVAAGGPYRLTAQCGRSGLKLAVNDLLLAEIVDPDFLPGSVGIAAGTYEKAGFKVGFDNFKLIIP